MKYKKHILLPGAILIYAIIMSFMSYKQYGHWTNQNTIILLIEIAIIVILFMLLKKRYNDRNKY